MVRVRRSWSKTVKALHLLADIQNDLHSDTIRHELSQMINHTFDPDIRHLCNHAAECLGLELKADFKKQFRKQHELSLATLMRHFKGVTDKFNDVFELYESDDFDREMVESTFSATERQINSLSSCLSGLHVLPALAYPGNNNELIQLGDLVAVLSKDEKNQEYEHYGIITVIGKEEICVTHFFTGNTVKPPNHLFEIGLGHVHELAYNVNELDNKFSWNLKEHLSDDMPFSKVQQCISKSRKTPDKVWNKASYNCEHWAREMFSGVPSCTQTELMKKEAKERIASKKAGD